MTEARHCTNCGTKLIVGSAFCMQCGSKVKIQEEPAPVESQDTTNVECEEAVFLANARLGLNRWWRWVIGPILILAIWQIIGAVPFLAACEYLMGAQISQFTCEGMNITGDSFIPGYVLSNYGFIIAIIGVWITVRLIHKKTLTQVVTGRVTFDYNRALYAIWIGLVVFAILFVLGRLFFHSEMTFRAPHPGEYVTFFLFAIVLTPYQAGVEEVFFRGYVIQGVSLLTRNRFFLVALTSVLFMAPHLFNPEPYEYGFGPYVSAMLMFGVFLSLMTLLDGGIELAVGYHAINNLWIGLVVNTEVTAMPTPSLFVIPMERYGFFPDLLVELIALSVTFAIFDRKYGWSSWARIKHTFQSIET